jgi:hypothetical protein
MTRSFVKITLCNNKKSEIKNEKNQKSCGKFLTFLCKNIVQLVINAILFNIKNTIISNVQNDPFFSVFLDITQNVSILGLCLIVLKFVVQDTILEN